MNLSPNEWNFNDGMSILQHVKPHKKRKLQAFELYMQQTEASLPTVEPPAQVRINLTTVFSFKYRYIPR